MEKKLEGICFVGGILNPAECRLFADTVEEIRELAEKHLLPDRSSDASTKPLVEVYETEKMNLVARIRYGRQFNANNQGGWIITKCVGGQWRPFVQQVRDQKDTFE